MTFIDGDSSPRRHGNFDTENFLNLLQRVRVPVIKGYLFSPGRGMSRIYAIQQILDFAFLRVSVSGAPSGRDFGLLGWVSPW